MTKSRCNPCTTVSAFAPVDVIVDGRRLRRVAGCKAWLSSAVLIGSAAAVPAVAADFAYDLRVSAGHTDNIGLTSQNEQEEDIAAAGVRFSVAQTTGRLQADAVGDFSYVEYLDDTFDSEVLGYFTGSALYSFIPERFEWMLEDNFGQVLNDPFSPPTPTNRENINYLTTGPNAALAFGSQTRLRLSGRYSLGTYEDNNLDFDTLGGELALERSLSQASSVSFHVGTSRTEYDDRSLNGDYDQTNAYVSYQVQGARTRIGVDAGYTSVDRDAADDKEDGLLLRVDMARRVSPSSTVTLSGGREFSNSGVAFASLQGNGAIGQGTLPGRQTAQPFVNDSATLGWNFERQRTSFGVAASWSEQSYEDNPQLDQKLTGGGARFRRELSPHTSLGLQAEYTQVDYRVGTDYDDLYGSLTFAWQVGQHLALSATYGYYERTADLPGGDATENRYLLTLSYGRGSPRDTPIGTQFPVDAAQR